MKKFKIILTTIIITICMLFATTVNVGAYSFNAVSGSHNSFIFTIAPILMTAFICVFITFIVIAVLSTIKSQKINSVMQQLSRTPDEQTACEAINLMQNTNTLIRHQISASGRSKGVHFEMWREVFNNVIIPCSDISPNIKETLRQQLIRFNTHGLHNVPVVQTPEEAKLAAKEFGLGGEKNVWHNLKVLASQPTCDIYRNVRINTGTTSSEIDAIIVDENKGILLIEIKSIGGKRVRDGYKHISFGDLKEDPSNQIIRHQYDFSSCFPDINLSGKIRNVLVFSWPNGEERRVVDKFTFSNMPYDVISVEQLLTYYQALPVASITSSERNLIVSRMGANKV